MVTMGRAMLNSLNLVFPIRVAVKLRGATMLMLGCFALVGTGDQITQAMNGVAFVVGGTALVEAAILLRDPMHKPVWWLTLSDALLALVYAGLTVLMPLISSANPLRAIAAVDAWLLAATLYAGVLALHAWDHRLPRVVLVAWMLLNAALAIAGPANPPVAIPKPRSDSAFVTCRLAVVREMWLTKTSRTRSPAAVGIVRSWLK